MEIDLDKLEQGIPEENKTSFIGDLPLASLLEFYNYFSDENQIEPEFLIVSKRDYDLYCWIFDEQEWTEFYSSKVIVLEDYDRRAAFFYREGCINYFIEREIV